MQRIFPGRDIFDILELIQGLNVRMIDFCAVGRWLFNSRTVPGPAETPRTFIALSKPRSLVHGVSYHLSRK